MCEVVSNISAAKFREEGNALYQRKKFSQALVCYNKSLCYSESNEMKSLVFANRSAVYLEAKKYQYCLDNIQLARQHGYPKEKLLKLDEREVKCRELMKNHKTDPFEDPWNFFKLSYPPNEKLPFVVDCLELRENSKYGRHIVTNHDLKPGDIIVIEEPWFKFLDWKNCYERCSNCLKVNMHSLIPCKGRCVNTMFCSEECADLAGLRHRIYECYREVPLPEDYVRIQKLHFQSIEIAGGINELQSCVDSNEKLTIFDIDMRNPNDPQVKNRQLIAFLNLIASSGIMLSEDIKIVTRMTSLAGEELKHFSQTFQRVCKISNRNNLAYDFKKLSKKLEIETADFGSSITLLCSFFNHSCDPNVIWSSVDNKQVVVVRTPIKAGDQLFLCYRHSFEFLPRDERRANLLKDYEFFCECNACINDFSPSHAKRITDRKFNKPSQFTLSVDPNLDLIKNFKKNCKYIQKNFKNHPCSETCSLTFHNIMLIGQISSNCLYVYENCDDNI